MSGKTNNGNSKRKGTFRKNVVEVKWAVLCRNEATGEKEAFTVMGETESVVADKIPDGYEVLDITEYGE